MSQRGATPPAGARRLAVPGRLRATAVAGLSWALCRLPEAPLVSLANAAGDLWYRLAPERAARARRNLGRVVSSLAASGRASESVRVAARDPLALERLVRLAFRHNVRYYLEVARLPTLTPSVIDRILQVETPDTVDEAFDGGGPVVFVGLHFGAIELPGLYLARRTGRRPLAPMETLDDPALQRWLERTRSTVGVQIVGLREARRTLLAAIRRGDPVGLIADRDITGGGIAVPFFGAPARIPAGPALVALESAARIYVASVRRARGGRYCGRVERVDAPVDGTRRERVEAIVAAEARAFERAIAVAPEQWWGAFFPIWPDLEGGSPLADPLEAGAPA